MLKLLKLPQKWIDYLAAQPETGMGWQRCIIKDKNGEHEAFVFNASDVINIDVDSITDVRMV